MGSSLSTTGNCGYTTKASGTGADCGQREISLRKEEQCAALGEGGKASVRSNGGKTVNGIEVCSAAVAAPVVATSWDPYQVWLTRVKQPRDQYSRMRRQERRTLEHPVTEYSDEAAQHSARPTTA
jgi:hypothetical protein